MAKCIICERRPAKEGSYCGQCNTKIDVDRKARLGDKPEKFLTYRGHVVGLFKNGNGRLQAKLLRRSADRLPKGKTIDLNVYCKGYTRQQIKDFKRCILKLAFA